MSHTVGHTGVGEKNENPGTEQTNLYSPQVPSLPFLLPALGAWRIDILTEPLGGLNEIRFLVSSASTINVGFFPLPPDPNTRPP